MSHPDTESLRDKQVQQKTDEISAFTLGLWLFTSLFIFMLQRAICRSRLRRAHHLCTLHISGIITTNETGAPVREHQPLLARGCLALLQPGLFAE